MSQCDGIVFSKRQFWDVLFLMLIYAVCICIFAGLNTNVLFDHATDSASYITIARNLVEKNGFANEEGISDGFRTPGYPLMLAFIYLLGGNNGCVIALQIALATLCLYLTYAICRMMGVDHRFAMFGAIMMALDFMTCIFTCYVLSDAYFMYFLVIAAFFLAKWVTQRRNRYYALFVVFLNYALLIRPILMYFNMLLCVLVIILWCAKRISIKQGLFTILVFAFVFFGWSYRNYHQTGVFEMSSVRNYNMFDFDGAMLRSNVEKISLDEAREKMGDDFAELYSEEQLTGLSKSQLHRLQSKVGRAYIKEHFGQYLLMNIEGLVHTILGLDRGLIKKVVRIPILSNMIAVAYFVYLCFVYAVYIVGWLVNFKKACMLDFFILTISGYCAVASASVGYPRFRVAFFALIVIGAVAIWKQTDMCGFIRKYCPIWMQKKRLK